ncbi:MAG TPA: DUF3488 and transglutaminase-like domain-containing protein [Pyrinomonadaceae bacterium]|nr:DUF3488 and transglutaminase-like domain-containing protein [Pyrinomonadaceae bacterium]
MGFSTYFRASSYAMVACGAMALAVTNGIGVALAALFLLLLVVAWNLEGTRWQLSERVGLLIVLLSLPLFYFDWSYQIGAGTARERVGVAALAHLIIFLSAVKIFQSKADRDWVFLYLISFFEALLAAGLSISSIFVLVMGVYMLLAISTITAFEIMKARRSVKVAETRLLVPPDSRLFRRLKKLDARRSASEARRLPFISLALLSLIFLLAIPLFFIAPRWHASALSRTNGGLSGFIGFSDHVTLGDIGRLNQSDRLVMRVRVENPQGVDQRLLRWRGVALDEFTGKGWYKSPAASHSEQSNNESNFFQVGVTDRESLSRLTTQTFFVEPIDTPVLFAAARPIAIQAALPFVRRDSEGSLSTRSHDQERLNYKAYSDTSEPPAEVLRRDGENYTRAEVRYMLLPSGLDERVGELAHSVIGQAGATNRYDAAKAIESYLRDENNFQYSLDLRAGGADPLADFLFKVRAGHCEYFSTAMAVMLRTQGIATRVVNGFQAGDYNETAGVYTVTERYAHSWVEVYFPGTRAWVTFDPTPAAGHPSASHTGLAARLGQYAEALDMFWMQYVVGYDRLEQRSLATRLRDGISTYSVAFSRKLAALQSTLREVGRVITGDDSAAGSTIGVAFLIALILAAFALAFATLWLVRRVRLKGWRLAFSFRSARQTSVTVVEFYERMIHALAAHGVERAPSETPLEFAAASDIPEVMNITRVYNRVRYGGRDLSVRESSAIEEWLLVLERNNK